MTQSHSTDLWNKRSPFQPSPLNFIFTLGVCQITNFHPPQIA